MVENMINKLRILIFLGLLTSGIVFITGCVTQSPTIPASTVTPMLTPTPLPTLLPTSSPTPATPPPLDVKIKSPAEGEKVPTNILISGTFSEEIQNDQYMWVVVHPYDSMGWWPQLGQIKPFRGVWNTQAVIGQGKDTGKEFDIAVILVNKESNQKYLNYMEEGKTTGNYPEIQLPQDAITYDRITVTRK